MKFACSIYGAISAIESGPMSTIFSSAVTSAGFFYASLFIGLFDRHVDGREKVRMFEDICRGQFFGDERNAHRKTSRFENIVGKRPRQEKMIVGREECAHQRLFGLEFGTAEYRE